MPRDESAGLAAVSAWADDVSRVGVRRDKSCGGAQLGKTGLFKKGIEVGDGLGSFWGEKSPCADHWAMHAP